MTETNKARSSGSLLRATAMAALLISAMAPATLLRAEELKDGQPTKIDLAQKGISIDENTPWFNDRGIKRYVISPPERNEKKGDQTVATTDTINWSGYGSNLSNSGMTYQAVQGSWQIPSATGYSRGDDASTAKDYSGQNEYSMVWTGIMGLTNNLLQAGTQSNLVNGKAQYIPWIEMAPNESAIPINGLTINAEDVFTIVINTVPNQTNQWTVTATDETTAQGYVTTLTFANFTPVYALWIFEDPEICPGGTNCYTAKMPDFKSPILVGDLFSYSSSTPASYASSGQGMTPLGSLPNVGSVTMTQASVKAVPGPLLGNPGTSFEITVQDSQVEEPIVEHRH